LVSAAGLLGYAYDLSANIKPHSPLSVFLSLLILLVLVT
jgi:hypothetical protein